MFDTDEGKSYLRDDIYFCEGCGQFHSMADNSIVDVPLTDMPADFAVSILLNRNGTTRKRPGSDKGKPKGFGKPKK